VAARYASETCSTSSITPNTQYTSRRESEEYLTRWKFECATENRATVRDPVASMVSMTRWKSTTLVKSGPAAVDQAESPPDHSRQFVQRCQTSPVDYLRSRVVLPSTVLHVCTACLRTAPSRSRQCRAISSSTRHRP
jgi:hypothetical protein